MDSRILPELFTSTYEALYLKSLDDGMAGMGSRNDEKAALGIAEGKPTGVARVSSSEVTSVGKLGPGSSKLVGKTSRTMKDERAFRLKVKVDKKLRAIAREVQAFLEHRDMRLAAARVCAGKCKKFGDAEWTYCARCGGPMREVESSD